MRRSHLRRGELHPTQGWALILSLLLILVSSLGSVALANGPGRAQVLAPFAEETATVADFDATATAEASATAVAATQTTIAATSAAATATAIIAATQTAQARPTISFTVDLSSIEYGTCTYLRWSVSGSNIQAVYLDGLQVALSGTRQICPAQTTTYSLQAIFPGGAQEALVQVRVHPRALSPTPTRTLTPSPTPFRTPTWTPVVALPTLTPTRPGEAFPPPSLYPSPTPWPTPLPFPSPTPPAIEPATPLPAIATPTPDLSQLAPPPVEAPPAVLPEGGGRRTRPTPRAVPQVAGGRQDILRLLAFGVIGVVGAAVLGVISLLLWKRD